MRRTQSQPNRSPLCTRGLVVLLALCGSCGSPGGHERPQLVPQEASAHAREYRPITLDTFVDSDPDRHLDQTERQRARVTVERVAAIESEGCGLHLLQPLRELDRIGDAPDGLMAGGHHYFRTRNRYAETSASSTPREEWHATWPDWPVSIEPLLENTRIRASLWDSSDYRGFRLELTFDRTAGERLAELVGPVSGTIPFSDWCDFTIVPGGIVTDMQAALVCDGTYYRPFSIRDIVLADRYPITVVAAEGLTREEAKRLMNRLQE